MHLNSSLPTIYLLLLLLFPIATSVRWTLGHLLLDSGRPQHAAAAQKPTFSRASAGKDRRSPATLRGVTRNEEGSAVCGSHLAHFDLQGAGHNAGGGSAMMRRDTYIAHCVKVFTGNRYTSIVQYGRLVPSHCLLPCSPLGTLISSQRVSKPASLRSISATFV